MSDGIGYLTPDVVQFGSVTECRTVTLPLSLWYLANGALQELTREENWVQFGTATPEETASFFLDALEYYGACMPVGTIVPLVVNTLPDGVLPCNGGAYLRVDYPDLYAVLPPALIVDADNFNTPDLTSRFLLAEGNGRSLGDIGGSETHALTIAEIPAHNHDYTPPILNLDLESPVGIPDIIAAGIGPITQTGNAGSGASHNNMPPYYTVKYGIVAR
jgi:microcystin-dependent protein